MKKFLLVFLFSFSLFGVEIKMLHSYDKAKKLQEKTGKIIYVLITAPECPWCHKFKTKTLPNRHIWEKLNKHFIPVELERGFDDIPKNLFKNRPVPRHYFVKDDKIIYDDLGYFKSAIFDMMMDEVLKDAKQK